METGTPMWKKITRSDKIQNLRSFLYCLISNRFQPYKLSKLQNQYPGSIVPLTMFCLPLEDAENWVCVVCAFSKFDYLPGWGWVVLCKWKVWDVLVWLGGSQLCAESFLSECVTLLHWHPDITLSHTTLMDWHRQLQIWIQNRNHSGARTPCQSLFLLWDVHHICHFFSTWHIFGYNFSPHKKRVNCDKTDFTVKQRKPLINWFGNKTG